MPIDRGIKPKLKINIAIIVFIAFGCDGREGGGLRFLHFRMTINYLDNVKLPKTFTSDLIPLPFKDYLPYVESIL